MINLKIDPEFQSQIPPLTDDEFKQLEENILKEGKLLSPLIVWNSTLVDGHNRYAILQKHPEICFSTMPLRFAQREFAAWQAEQAHHTPSKEKQSVPDGERPVVHIAIVCGLWQGASYSGAHPVFCFALNLLAYGSRLHSLNIPPGHRSEANRHNPAGHCK